MLARRRQSSSVTMTADDTESAPDVPTPTGKDRCSSPTPSHSRPTHRPAAMSSGTGSRRRVGATSHAGQQRARTPTSSPEPDSSLHVSHGRRSAAESAAAVHGKTQFRYKRVKDSVRQQQKRGHLPLASRKSDARQEGIFD